MLIGEHTHTLDSKKRLAIPAKFRKELGEGAVLTKGLDSCLFMFPNAQWHQLAQKIAGLSLGQQDTRSFSRLLLAGAVEVDFDGLGRILVPDYLKSYAGLTRQVVVVGLYSRLELWDEARWDSYRANIEQHSDQIAEKLGELGFV